MAKIALVNDGSGGIGRAISGSTSEIKGVMRRTRRLPRDLFTPHRYLNECTAQASSGNLRNVPSHHTGEFDLKHRSIDQWQK
jgi:hypothetical protein